MAHTAETLRNKSANLIAGINQPIIELKRTNAEIVAMIAENEKIVEEKKAQHEKELAQLRADSQALAELLEKNSIFIEKFEQVFNE